MRQKLVAYFLMILLVFSCGINAFTTEAVYGSSNGTIDVSYNQSSNIITVSGTTVDEDSKLSLLAVRINDGFRAHIDAAISAADGKFSFSFPLGYGEYRITVNSPTERLMIEKYVLKATDSPGGEENDPRPGGKSSSGGASGDVHPPLTNVIKAPTPVLNTSTGAANTTISGQAVSTALSASSQNPGGIREVEIQVPAVPGANAYNVVLPSAYLNGNTANPTHVMQIQTALGSINAPSNMLSSTGMVNANDNVGISIGLANSSSIPESLRAQIGDRQVFDINIEVNGVRRVWNNPDAPATISLNYTPTAEELSNPDNIVIWYLDEASNTPVPIPNCKYDPATGKVTFTITHFSKYVVTYTMPKLTDIEGYPWAYRQINAMVAKDIIKTEETNKYEPGENVTRADFIFGLIRALGLTAKFDNNFSDVSAGDYYYKEIGTAKTLGITEGTGNNKFNPETPITRQDMMVLTARALTKAGKLSATAAADLGKFDDNSDIADYARESVSRIVSDGIIVGSGSSINPRGMTSRAETAVILYRIFNK